MSQNCIRTSSFACATNPDTHFSELGKTDVLCGSRENGSYRNCSNHLPQNRRDNLQPCQNTACAMPTEVVTLYLTAIGDTMLTPEGMCLFPQGEYR